MLARAFIIYKIYYLYQKGSLTPVDIANYVSGGRLNKVDNRHQVSWAGQKFEVSQLRDVNYKSDGKIETMARSDLGLLLLAPGTG